MDVADRLPPPVARRLIREILEGGSVSWSDHAKAELVKDKLTIPDCLNVLRAGVVEEPELVNGSWRYRVRTQRIYVVVAFRSETELIDSHRLESAEMKCLTCGEPMKSRRENYHYKESGLANVILVNVEVRTCAACGTREVVIPRIDELHRAIARALITRKSKLGAEEIRYLRKYLGWSGADFAAYMAVQPETVSRWESGSQQMGPVADRLLRLLVAQREPVTHYPIDLFKQRLHRAAKATLRFKADPNWRSDAA